MFEGRATGGPLDGVKLTAPYEWDGIVNIPRKSSMQAKTYYPGRYKWHFAKQLWEWQSLPTVIPFNSRKPPSFYQGVDCLEQRGEENGTTGQSAP